MRVFEGYWPAIRLVAAWWAACSALGVGLIELLTWALRLGPDWSLVVELLIGGCAGLTGFLLGVRAADRRYPHQGKGVGTEGTQAVKEAEIPAADPVEIDNEFDARWHWRLSLGARGPVVRVCHYCRKPIEGEARALFSGKFHCGCNPEAEAESKSQEHESRVEHAGRLLWFELHRPCAKCGNERRQARLHDSAGRSAETGGCGALFCAGGIWPHIERQCGVCGDLAYELPLDFEP